MLQCYYCIPGETAVCQDTALQNQNQTAPASFNGGNLLDNKVLRLGWGFPLALQVCLYCMREKHKDINGLVHPLGVENGCSACWNNTFASSGVFFRYSYWGTFQKWETSLFSLADGRLRPLEVKWLSVLSSALLPKNSHIINHRE